MKLTETILMSQKKSKFSWREMFQPVQTTQTYRLIAKDFFTLSIASIYVPFHCLAYQHLSDNRFFISEIPSLQASLVWHQPANCVGSNTMFCRSIRSDHKFRAGQLQLQRHKRSHRYEHKRHFIVILVNCALLLRYRRLRRRNCHCVW